MSRARISRRRFAAGMLGAGMLLGGISGARAQQVSITAAPAESYRIRFINQAGGAIEASTDGGKTWLQLGKVTRPATTTTLYGNPLSICPQGKVAGVTADSMLIRVPAGKGLLRAIRILSASETPSAAAISTDQRTQSDLFRSLAPPVGSEVQLEQGGLTTPLPVNYSPKPGDRLVVLIPPPATAEAPSIVIENKVGGEVVLSTPGGVPRVLAKVKHPLLGIGRYAGTEKGGSGCVLSWMPSMVLVSTASGKRSAEDPKREERGGFVIQPAEQAQPASAPQGNAHPASQILIEALGEGASKLPVSPFFAQPAPLSSGDPYDAAPTRVEVRIDGGAWEPMPDLRGVVDEDQLVRALVEATGRKRTIHTGITHLRILFGTPTEDVLARRIRLAATPLAGDPQRGIVTITANVMGGGVEFVKFFLNGKLMQITNRAPFAWKWDTTSVPNGEHLIEIQGLDGKLAVVSTNMARVRVDN